jgi:hypothetical protein
MTVDGIFPAELPMQLIGLPAGDEFAAACGIRRGADSVFQV